MRVLWMVVVLALSSSPAAAEAVAGWSILRIGKACHMVTSYENGGTLGISRDARDEMFTVFISNKNWQSLVDGSEHELDVQLTGGRQIWTSKSFATNKNGNEPSLVFAVSDDDFAVDLMVANAMIIRENGVVIDKLSLAGTSKAMLATVKCANDLLLQSNDDPFANK